MVCSLHCAFESPKMFKKQQLPRSCSQKFGFNLLNGTLTVIFFKTPGGVQCAARADSHFNRKNKSGRTPIFRSEGNTGLTLPQFRINESKLFPFPFSTWSHRRNYFELNYCPTYLLNKSIFLLGNKSNLFFEIWVENTKILFLQSAQFEVIYSISC